MVRKATMLRKEEADTDRCEEFPRDRGKAQAADPKKLTCLSA